MGRTALMIVAGLIVNLGILTFNLNRSTIEAVDNTTAYYEKATAQFLAKSALNFYLYQLAAQPSLRGTFAENAKYFNSGKDTVVISDNPNSMVDVQVSAWYAEKQHSILATVEVISDSAWPYVLFTDTDKLELKKGPGTVTGHLHSNNKIKIKYDKVTIIGTVTVDPPVVALPTIDWDFFKNAATAAGQYSDKDITLDLSGSPYSGVWYSKKSIKIKDGVVINGTVAAEKDIKFDKDNITITANPANYPAILSKKSVKADKKGIQINGFVYADKDFKIGENFVLNGAAAAKKKIFKGKKNFAITYNAAYTTNLSGVTFDALQGSDQRVTIVSLYE